MKCEECQKLVPDFLTGELDRKSRAVFDEHIARCPGCAEELRRVSEMWTKLGVLPMEQPSSALRGRFYDMLEAYKEGLEGQTETKPARGHGLGINLGPWFRRPAFAAAAALLLVVLGVSGGYFFGTAKLQRTELARLQAQVEDLRQTAALTLIQNDSASERLRGVSFSAGVDNPSPRTLDALLRTLDTDPSDSVRLAAADALYLFAGQPEVKQGILSSLGRQTSPLVQVALINLLVDLREHRAVESLKALIQNERINVDVKRKAEQGIQTLSAAKARS